MSHYQEFAAYYARERCRWAPENPLRVYNLAIRTLWPEVRDRMTLDHFMATVYATLGFRRTKPDHGKPKIPPGLFHDFDPDKYHGTLPPEDHFVNLFKKRLWGKLGRELRPRTDKRKKGDRFGFVARPHLGLRRGRETPRSRHEQERLDLIPEALATLDPQEQQLVRLVYWDDRSKCEAAVDLKVNRRTVTRRHDEALRKLRRYYEVAG